MTKFIALFLLVVAFFGTASAAEMKAYQPNYSQSVVASRDDSTGVVVASPAATQVIASGSPLVTSWTIASSIVNYDRVVALTGNKLRSGVFYQLPFTAAVQKGSGTLSVPVVDALIDQLVGAFAHIDGQADIDPAAVAQNFFIEIRGEVTDNHTLTGNPQYAVAIGDSGTFTLQKSVATAITSVAVGAPPSGVVVGQSITLTATATVLPASVTPTASFNWADGTTSPAVATSLGNGLWSFAASHVWTVASAGFYGSITITAGSATATAPFTIAIGNQPPVQLPLYLSDIVASNLQVLVSAGWKIQVSGGDGINKAGKVIAKSPDGSQMLTFASTPPKKKK